MVIENSIQVGSIETHFLQAGSGPPLILLHGGEHGASARNSWEETIDTLSEHFHIYAPDLIGYGQTDKWYCFDIQDKERYESFTNQWASRIYHIEEFLKTIQVDEAAFMGNSFGAEMILDVAAENDPQWPITKAIAISGGWGGPRRDPEPYEPLFGYDEPSSDAYRETLEALIKKQEILTEEFVKQRFETSMLPGAWEAANATRIKTPLRDAEKPPPSYEKYKGINIPVLLVNGADDELSPNDFPEAMLQHTSPNISSEVFKNCGHCAQLEHPEKFNQLALEFLLDS